MIKRCLQKHQNAQDNAAKYTKEEEPEEEQKSDQEQYGTKGKPLPRVVGGQLNPDWVEWLMGWPIGWTDLKPLATDRFQEWLRLHGRS